MDLEFIGRDQSQTFKCSLKDGMFKNANNVVRYFWSNANSVFGEI